MASIQDSYTKHHRQKSTIQIDTRKTYSSMDKYNHQKKNGSETKSPQKRPERPNRKKDMRLIQKVQWEIRHANKKYMEEVSTEYKDNSKTFWSYIKCKGQEWIGVAPLKNKMRFLQNDNKSKTEILNEQFQSVFTKENLNNFPNKGKSPYSTMEDIKINSKGVDKLLKNLKPHKATGPDSIPSFILKAAADQLAPILTELYQTSLTQHRSSTTRLERCTCSTTF